MGVKINHTVGAQNQEFSKCISDGHASRNMGTTKESIWKMYAFVHRNLMYTRKTK